MTSTECVINVDGISKRYVLGQTHADLLSERLERMLRRRPGARRSQAEEFWALRDVTFQVDRGEIIGIIGRNGAGKSTLLKILSRITRPTSGRLEFRGRLASLLEIGTGFHPELTGRENAFLNGAILGMRRAEIARRLDEIVAFAEIERFLDTPVKRYSSGMYVRLAFAVAAHLDSAILVIDEVLAVGDAEFQKKCLGKIAEVGRDGRTVLFVSHNMGAIARLCSRAILLDGGALVLDGDVRTVTGRYLSRHAGARLAWAPTAAAGPFAYHRVAVEFEGHATGAECPADSTISIRFDFTVSESLPPGRLALLLADASGTVVLSSASTDGDSSPVRRWSRGRQVLSCQIPGSLLAPGRYSLTISEPNSEGGDLIHEGVLSFGVAREHSLAERDGRAGVLMPLLRWSEGEPK